MLQKCLREFNVDRTNFFNGRFKNESSRHSATTFVITNKTSRHRMSYIICCGVDCKLSTERMKE